MTVLEAVLGFAVVAAVLTVIPGLDTALVLRSSLTRSRSSAVATAPGRFMRWIDRVTGGVLVVFGSKLALGTRF